ncbi:hypothetical protein [Spiroplasma endosymbiont of Stenodema calcarata]|uniref:hypothetical protein n=1 Tax=Spiroplasma endosymbiont of Stenodema calcarata TaxID=3139328 RepID=UPI003CCB6E6F
MKRILSLFTTVSLLTPTVNTIISCNKVLKYVSDDESNDIDNGNDIEILNNINARIKNYFQGWWETKATIDINKYPDQVEKFKESVANLKTKDSQVLTGAAIRQWRFLDQLYTAFEAEFDNLNHEIKNEYSNYYINAMPLSLEANDISFTLQNINFDNLAKLFLFNNDNIVGIKLSFNIRYEFKFKDLQQHDELNGLVVICNDLEVLSGIQNNLEKQFLLFVDDIFKKQNYEIVGTGNYDFNYANGYNSILPVITKALEEKELLYQNQFVLSWNNKIRAGFNFNRPLYKSGSVLAWAGERYDPQELTAEKFLKFYKQHYFNASVQKNYYIAANIDSFIPKTFTIENLPFKNNYEKKRLLTPIKVLLPKDFVDERLKQFAETTMRFWHDYQLETYDDKLVFKMNQTDYDMILKVTNSFSPGKTSVANLGTVFKTIFKMFNKTVDSKITVEHSPRVVFAKRGKANLIKRTNSFILEYLHRRLNYMDYGDNTLNFSYNSFAYGLFINPNPDETNTNNPREFLQTFEFKVA